METQSLAMSALTCGVDIGSTNVKVILVGEWPARLDQGRSDAARFRRKRRSDRCASAGRDDRGNDHRRLADTWPNLLFNDRRCRSGRRRARCPCRPCATRPCASLVRPAGRDAGERSATNSRYAAQAGIAIESSRTAAKWLAPREPSSRAFNALHLDNSDRLSSRGLDGLPFISEPCCSNWPL